MSLFSHKHSRAPPTGRPRRPRRRRTVAGPRRSCVGRTLALAAAGCCAMHFLPYAASCPPQTAIVGQPNCDELLVLLNDTAGCAHLEYAFSFNCSGCVCAPPSSSETTTTVDPAIAAQAAADQRQLMGAMWTLVAAAVVIVGIVVATLVHKMHSNAVVLPENEKRPMSDEELAKVRRAQLRMKTHRFSRSQEKLSKKSVLTMPHRELIAASTRAIDASIKQSVASAFLNYSVAARAAHKLAGHYHENHDIEEGVRTVDEEGDLGVEERPAAAAAAAAAAERSSPSPSAGTSSAAPAAHSSSSSSSHLKTTGSSQRVSVSPVEKPARAMRSYVTEVLNDDDKQTQPSAQQHTPPVGGSGPRIGGGASQTAVSVSTPAAPGPEDLTTREAKLRASNSSSIESKRARSRTPETKAGGGVARPKSSKKKKKRRSKNRLRSADSSEGSVTPGPSSSVTPEPTRTSATSGGGEWNPLTPHHQLAATTTTTTTPSSSSSSSKKPTPATQVHTQSSSGSLNDESEGGALNRIATHHQLEVPTVRRIDSSFFAKSPGGRSDEGSGGD